MSTTPSPVSNSQLLEWAGPGDAGAGFSPLSAAPFLLLDAEAGAATERELAVAALWLSRLACPTIGIAAAGTANALTRSCDVLVQAAAEAAPLIANIRRKPIAAAVLVQVLRSTATLPPEQALTVESLAYATLQAGAEYQGWLAENRAPATAAITDSGPPVVVEREHDQLRITLNRAGNRNAISVEVRDALIEAFALVQADESIVSATVSGRGKCFSAGGDLSEFGSVPDAATGHIIRSLCLPARQLLLCADRVSFHLHGACIGAGIELPAFAARVTAAADTFFQLPELRFGLIPGAGGCVSIPRRIGRQRAAWLALSGKRINAAQALAWGLVDAVVD